MPHDLFQYEVAGVVVVVLACTAVFADTTDGGCCVCCGKFDFRGGRGVCWLLASAALLPPPSSMLQVF